jgi:hypothetical protein
MGLERPPALLAMNTLIDNGLALAHVTCWASAPDRPRKIRGTSPIYSEGYIGLCGQRRSRRRVAEPLSRSALRGLLHSTAHRNYIYCRRNMSSANGVHFYPEAAQSPHRTLYTPDTILLLATITATAPIHQTLTESRLLRQTRLGRCGLTLILSLI